MADRTSAAAWGAVFRILAQHEPDSTVVATIARDLWGSNEFQRADFTYDQMCEDDALIQLGLAKRNREGSIAEALDGRYRYAEPDGSFKT